MEENNNKAAENKPKKAKGLKQIKSEYCSVIYWEKGQNFNPNTGEVEVKNRRLTRIRTAEAENFIHQMNVRGYDCAVEE